ncbi:MAG TPA: hypothetical protein DIS66_02360, partial [Candidatus Omnitrophica bacterium]|nr:hypothetical protein [Candidatus Omnitrophota bacterium]
MNSQGEIVPADQGTKTRVTYTIAKYEADSEAPAYWSGNALEYSVQAEVNMTYGGQTGEWTKVWSSLNSEFQYIEGQSEIRLQLTKPLRVQAEFDPNTGVPKNVAIFNKDGSVTGFGADADPITQAEADALAERDVTLVVSGLNQTMNGAAHSGVEVETSLQILYKDVTVETKTGDWMQVMSGLNSDFSPKTDSRFTLQMEEKSSSGISTGRTFMITGFDDASFSAGDLDRVIQQVMRGEEVEGFTGDWVKTIRNLNYGFAEHDGSNYSMSLSSKKIFIDKETGKLWKEENLDLTTTEPPHAGNPAHDKMKADAEEVTLSISGFNKEFNGGNLSRSIQIVEKNATYEGKTGDWTRSYSRLGNGFEVQLTSDFSRQLIEKVNGKETGRTFIISGYEKDFQDKPTVRLRFSSQELVKGPNGEKETTLVPDNITGEWMKIKSNLGRGFEEGANSKYSMQMSDDETTYTLSEFDSTFAMTDKVKRGMQIQEKDVAYAGLMEKLSDSDKAIITSILATLKKDPSAITSSNISGMNTLLSEMKTRLSAVTGTDSLLLTQLGEIIDLIPATVTSLNADAVLNLTRRLEGYRGDWVRVYDNLDVEFVAKDDSRYSRSLQITDTATGLTSAYTISGYKLEAGVFKAPLDAQSKPMLSYSRQTSLPTGTYFGMIGDWVRSESNLSDNFQITDTTKYSMQMQERDASGAETGNSYTVLGFKNNQFTDDVNLDKQTLQYRKQSNMTSEQVQQSGLLKGLPAGRTTYDKAYENLELAYVSDENGGPFGDNQVITGMSRQVDVYGDG